MFRRLDINKATKTDNKLLYFLSQHSSTMYTLKVNLLRSCRKKTKKTGIVDKKELWSLFESWYDKVTKRVIGHKEFLYAHHVGNQVSHFVLSQIKCDTCIDDTVDTINA